MVQRVLSQPGLPGALNIARDDAPGVGVDPVDDDLDRRSAGREDTPGEVAAQHDHGVDLAVDDRLLGLLAVAHQAGVEVLGIGQRGRKAGSLAALALDDQRDRDVLGVQRHSIAEQQQAPDQDKGQPINR